MTSTPELFYAYPTSEHATKFGFKDTGCYHFTFAGNNYAAASHTEINYLAAINGLDLKPMFGGN